jgi:hypothetical protein
MRDVTEYFTVTNSLVAIEILGWGQGEAFGHEIFGFLF